MNRYKIVNLIMEAEWLPAWYEFFRWRGENVCPQKNGTEETVCPEYPDISVCYRPLPDMDEAFDMVTEVSGLKIGFGKNGWAYEDIETGCRMHVDQTYSKAVLSENVKKYPRLWGFLVQLLLECRLLDEQVLTLHSSCVQVKERAYAFSGPSGCGKSTRARSWMQVFDAKYLSGDRPAVDVGRKKAYGIPWDGKEQIFRNENAELSAVLQVRRAGFTRLRRLSARQARDFLIRQIFIPMWDNERSMEAMVLLSRLIRSVPVLRLFCDQDLKAAEETGNILFEHKERILEERVDMKLNEGFTVKSMAGENVIMPVGGNIRKFNGTVILNEVSAFIVKKIEAGSISRDDLLELVLSEYEVDRETAAKDLDELLSKLCDMGVVSRA